MKELIGTATNIAFTLDTETGEFKPSAEIILMLSEPQYTVTDEGVERGRDVETFRFMSSAGGMGMLMKSLMDLHEEMKRQAGLLHEPAARAEPGREKRGAE
jgi:hypothetical protein